MRSMIFPLVALALAAPAWAIAASPAGPAASIPSELTDPAPCVAPAAEYHKVNPWVLKAILKVESNFNPRAANRNANGTVDVGMAQINSMHFDRLRKYGITPAHLMDGCVSTYVAAWHLASKIREHGNTWFSVAAYHSTTPCQNERYRGLIWNTLVDWKVVAGPKVTVRSLAQCGYIAPGTAQRVVRIQGQALAFDTAD